MAGYPNSVPSYRNLFLAPIMQRERQVQVAL
jgi:hypothetical protein